MSSSAGATKPVSNIRDVQLAKAYKFCVRRIMDTVDARIGGDNVIREAVMVELQVFYHKSKQLMDGVEPHLLEEFIEGVDQLLCQFRQISGT